MKKIKEESFGIVPIYKEGEEMYFCLVKHKDAHWAFPKGGKEDDEAEDEAALRELEEETGIEGAELLYGEEFYEEYEFEKDGILHEKKVKYFVGFVPSMRTNIAPEFKHEIEDVRFLHYEQAKETITFPEGKQLLDEVVEVLNKKEV